MMPPEKSSKGLRAWLPVIGLALAAFIFNTSEFLPVGLLPEIAADLHSSVEHTGLIITGYAWVVALMSLPMTILTAKIERRRLLLWLILVFVLSHCIVLWANTFPRLFFARICVALTHSIFWSIMTPLAARMAPRGKEALGLASVMGGTIIATVLGVPIGTLLGQWAGWENAFFIVGMIAAVIWGLVFLTLPLAPANQAGSLKSLPSLLKRPGLLQLYALTAVTMLGEFTVYSYISPMLQNAGWPQNEVATVLLVFGLAGILETFISTKLIQRFLSQTFIISLGILGCAAFLLDLVLKSPFLLYCNVTVWGAAITSVCLALQTILLREAKDAADVASSMYSGIFNIGIGGGAAFGGVVAFHWGYGWVSAAGSFFIFLSFAATLGVFLVTGDAVLGRKKPTIEQSKNS